MKTQVFLARKKKPRVVHLWNGEDTLCNMYSTGGLVKDKYETITSNKELPVCQMCQNAKQSGR